MHNEIIPSSVFAAYRDLGSPIAIEPIIIGLLNKTYVVTTSSTKYVLQEMSPIFDRVVTEDSFAICTHLERMGMLAPTPYKTVDDKLIVEMGAHIFRALKFLDGKSYNAVRSPAMAKSAGMVVGQFHVAVRDIDYVYRSRRRNGGDYDFHRDNLIAALNNHPHHDYATKAALLAREMLAALAALTDGFTTTPRHVHGDPKVSNILFDDDDSARCLVDFDTLSTAGWSFEMGDALRSWCNPYPEDVLDAHADLKIAEASLAGYGAIMRGMMSSKEIDELLVHAQAVSLCLAIRYLADVLNENYFRYDTTRFARAADHQWLKAQAMLNLHRDFVRKAPALAVMMDDLLRPQ